MSFTTVAHISTLRANSLILATLLLSLLWTTKDRFFGVIDIPKQEETFSKAVSLFTLKDDVSKISELLLYPEKKNKQFDHLKFTKFNNTAIQTCELVKDKKTTSKCQFKSFKNQSIYQFIHSAQDNDGVCLTEKNGDYSFDIGNIKQCTGKKIRFNSSLTMTPLKQLKDMGMENATTQLRANNSNDSRLTVSGIIQSIRLVHTDRRDTYSNDFDAVNELSKYENDVLKSGISCKQLVRTPACYYEELNTQTRSVIRNSVNIPYLSLKVTTLQAVTAIMILILLTNFSTYTNARVALNNVNTGLDQNFALLDNKNNFICKLLLKIHTYSLYITSACLVLLMIVEYKFFNISSQLRHIGINFFSDSTNQNILAVVLFTFAATTSLILTSKIDLTLMSLRDKRQKELFESEKTKALLALEEKNKEIELEQKAKKEHEVEIKEKEELLASDNISSNANKRDEYESKLFDLRVKLERIEINSKRLKLEKIEFQIKNLELEISDLNTLSKTKLSLEESTTKLESRIAAAKKELLILEIEEIDLKLRLSKKGIQDAIKNFELKIIKKQLERKQKLTK